RMSSSVDPSARRRYTVRCGYLLRTGRPGPGGRGTPAGPLLASCLRQAAGLTQEQRGGRARLPQPRVAKLERGERGPAWATRPALAAALGVPCDQFRGAATDPAPAKRGRPRKAPAAGLPPAQKKPKVRRARRPRGG